MFNVKNYKRLTIDRLNDEGCMNLLTAFVTSLTEEYKNAMAIFLQDKTDKENYKHLVNLREYILSEHFANMTHLDGETILAKLDRPYLDLVG